MKTINYKLANLVRNVGVALVWGSLIAAAACAQTTLLNVAEARQGAAPGAYVSPAADFARRTGRAFTEVIDPDLRASVMAMPSEEGGVNYEVQLEWAPSLDRRICIPTAWTAIATSFADRPPYTSRAHQMGRVLGGRQRTYYAQLRVPAGTPVEVTVPLWSEAQMRAYAALPIWQRIGTSVRGSVVPAETRRIVLPAP